MATPKEIRDSIDARLAVLWPNLVSRQNTYAAAHSGKFYQGYRTHAANPADGTSTAGDRLASKPSDQAEAWAAFGVLSWNEAFSLEIHAYDGPAGRGWVGIVCVTLGGRTFQRSRGQGLEDRNQGWTDVTGA